MCVLPRPPAWPDSEPDPDPDRERERENPQQMCEVRALCVWGILNRISVI